MKILGIDSSSTVASVALVEDNVLLGEYTINHKKTHSQTLLPMISELFNNLEMEIDTIDLIAITKGPGSFTGLRIGGATAKGLGLALSKDIVGIPTTEAMAYNLFRCDGLICPIMDARRNQVYTGVYAFDEDELTNVVEQQPIEIDKLVAILEDLYKETGKTIVFLGDGVPVFRRYIDEKLSAKHTYAPAPSNRQRASSVATLGLKYYNEGQAVKHEEYTPEYLRKSQAEMVKDGKRI